MRDLDINGCLSDLTTVSALGVSLEGALEDTGIKVFQFLPGRRNVTLNPLGLANVQHYRSVGSAQFANSFEMLLCFVLCEIGLRLET